MVEIQNQPEQLPASHTETATEPTSLWQDAYQHPGRTALEAAAVVAGVAVLGAGGYKIAAELAKPSALLVEDTPYMGKGLQYVLKQQGFKVTWLTGVAKADPFTGMALNGKQFLVNPSNFKAALLDGELGGSPLQGGDIAKVLAGKVPTIGTSSVRDINQAMIANGADAAANKATIFTGLATKQFDLMKASNDVAGIQPLLDRITETLQSPDGRPLRHLADKILKKYM